MKTETDYRRITRLSLEDTYKGQSEKGCACRGRAKEPSSAIIHPLQSLEQGGLEPFATFKICHSALSLGQHSHNAIHNARSSAAFSKISAFPICWQPLWVQYSNTRIKFTLRVYFFFFSNPLKFNFLHFQAVYGICINIFYLRTAWKNITKGTKPTTQKLQNEEHYCLCNYNSQPLSVYIFIQYLNKHLRLLQSYLASFSTKDKHTPKIIQNSIQVGLMSYLLKNVWWTRHL